MKPSGELNAVLLLARAIETHDAQAQFEGIGAELGYALGAARLQTLARSHRLGEHGTCSRRFRVFRRCLPPCGAPRCPIFAAEKPDLIVLVDFGAFNMRLAKTLPRMRLKMPAQSCICFRPQPGWIKRAWLARVGAMTVAPPVTAFAHQYDFYKSHRLPDHVLWTSARGTIHAASGAARAAAVGRRNDRTLARQSRRRIEISRAGAAGCAQALARLGGRPRCAGRLRRSRYRR